MKLSGIQEKKQRSLSEGDGFTKILEKMGDKPLVYSLSPIFSCTNVEKLELENNQMSSPILENILDEFLTESWLEKRFSKGNSNHGFNRMGLERS